MRSRLLATAVAAVALVLTACGPEPAPPTPQPGRYVAGNGVDVGDCATPSTACATINYAVAKAQSAETVFVAAGTYPEMVVVDKPLKFSGPNAGRNAGTTPIGRFPEATVKGFRSPGSPHPSATYSFDVTIDGFTVDPQGDSALLTPDTMNLISLYGGSDVKVINNIIRGGPYVPTCGYTCTTMADSAVRIASGTYVVSGNLVENFRRPLDIEQPNNATPVVSGTYSGNVVQNFTWRAFWAAEWGTTFGANTVTISGNEIIGTDDIVANTPPTGALVTAGGVTFSDNLFKNLDTGVYEQYCGATNPGDIPTRYLNNTFDQVGLGLQLHVVGDCTGRNPSAEVKGNAFLSGPWAHNGDPITGIAWYGTPPAPLDATCNFWGDASGPGVGNNPAVSANVDTTPWQTTKGGAC